jgi:hypothetical protein
MFIKLKDAFWLCWMITLIGLTACSSQWALQKPPAYPKPETSLKTISVDPSKVVMGQTLYVPVYSHIYYYNSQDHVINLSATLSIRNTDLTNSIIITSVRYYDSNGQLVRQDITNPVELKPLASTEVFIAADDTRGGVGANFIVEWVAEKTVYEPVIEAVMISTSSSQGISFVSPAKVLKQQGIQN